MMSLWRTLTACVGLELTTFGCANLPVTPKPYIDRVQSGGTQFDGVYRGAVQIMSTGPEIPRDWCQPASDHMIRRHQLHAVVCKHSRTSDLLCTNSVQWLLLRGRKQVRHHVGSGKWRSDQRNDHRRGMRVYVLGATILTV
jgi:hypothetical protein